MAPSDPKDPKADDPKGAETLGKAPKQKPSRAGEAGLPEALRERLAELPTTPGCYVFRDSRGEPLYVGKAKSLRGRVRSYFQDSGSDLRAFIPLLRRHVHDVETFVTATEKEAAILENGLIKEKQPRFNVKLRDDKEFLTLRLDLRGEARGGHRYPRLTLVRRSADDGARYFGPYHSATAARRTLHLVEKHFQLRTCSDHELASRRRPCLQYQIKRCLAPCVFPVDEAYYAEQVNAVALFLTDRHDELTQVLEERMQAASRAFEFELAATYRDQLAAVKLTRERQRVVITSDVDQDALGLFRAGDLVEVAVLHVRKGRVVEASTFSLSRVELPDDELVAAFLRDHYGDDGRASSWIPDEVLVPTLPDAAQGVAEWLSERRAAQLTARGERPRRCQVLTPTRGPRAALCALAMENAQHAFREKQRDSDDVLERLARVQQKLRLPTLPRRIECCDISHLGGKDTVGSVVALLDGKPDKARYRTYRVRLASAGDDYGAMYEVLTRRFARGLAAPEVSSESVTNTVEERAPERLNSAEELDHGSLSELLTNGAEELEDDSSEQLTNGVEELDVAESSEQATSAAGGQARASEVDWSLPDLFVVDGGRGQLGVALTAAHDLGLHSLPIVGLAKERERPGQEKVVDRVYLPGQKNPISLRPNSPELYLLAAARDEAHRFANRGRKQVGKRERLGSRLDQVPGVGPVLRQRLLSAFGSVVRISRATDEQLLQVRGVGEKQVALLRQHLAPSDASDPAPPGEPAPTVVPPSGAQESPPSATPPGAAPPGTAPPGTALPGTALPRSSPPPDPESPT
ncbi:MAG: excinuclease ABC subunit UvrC [Polyangiaceae bacterium]|nr:excinuclease ABC subunit UvrC [Polyangiaceae bacterium]MCW5790659.1 excinuclease ABC subunit UvrC [Polyangiaceae bacterium]